MEILLYTVDGGVTRLVQDDEFLAEQICQSIHPKTLYAQPNLIVMASGALHSFSTSAITRIDVLTTRAFEFPLPESIVSLRAIPTAEFQNRYPVDRLPPLPDYASVFAEFAIAGCAPQFVEVLLDQTPRVGLDNVSLPVDSSLVLQQRLSQSVFFFECEGGVSLVNSAHLLRMSLYPAPAPAPMDNMVHTAWIAALA